MFRSGKTCKKIPLPAHVMPNKRPAGVVHTITKTILEFRKKKPMHIPADERGRKSD